MYWIIVKRNNYFCEEYHEAFQIKYRQYCYQYEPALRKSGNIFFILRKADDSGLPHSCCCRV